MASYINKFEGDADGTITVSNANGLQYRLTTYADDSSEAVPIGRGGTGASTAATARTNLGLGSLATLNSVGAAQIDANAVGSSEIAADAVGSSEIAANAVGSSEIASSAVGASELAVTGNGTSGQVLTSAGNGSFTWTTPASQYAPAQSNSNSYHNSGSQSTNVSLTATRPAGAPTNYALSFYSGNTQLHTSASSITRNISIPEGSSGSFQVLWL